MRVVATHHKTGTALMHDVFSAIARHLTNKKYGAFADVRAMEDHPDAFSARKKARGTNARRAGVVLDYHLGKAVPDFVVDDEIATRDAKSGPTRSFSPDAGLPFALTAGRADGRDAYRMVHVVRDPVEVLISGYLYHRRLPKDERWLFRPAPGDASGRSHAESLRSASPTQAMRAELRAADDELRMLVLAYRHVERDPDAINVKLESFFEDFDGAVAETLRFLRFDEEDIPGCVALARAFDTKRWSEEERSRNEHFTQREDRGAFRDAVFADPFLNKTTAYARYAPSTPTSGRSLIENTIEGSFQLRKNSTRGARASPSQGRTHDDARQEREKRPRDERCDERVRRERELGRRVRISAVGESFAAIGVETGGKRPARERRAPSANAAAAPPRAPCPRRAPRAPARPAPTRWRAPCSGPRNIRRIRHRTPRG